MLLMLAGLFLVTCTAAAPALAAGSTDQIHILKYAVDRTTVISENTVSYQWMKDNLSVYGNGVTHYYHQGPVFEGDMWDPSETQNLKDKGAVMGTNTRDLCDLVGGMVTGDEVRLVAVDGWYTEFAYENIYEPMERQGPIILCWFNGDDATTGEKYGTGYPGIEGYHTAMQIVFMANTTNTDGKYVFGNDDMRVCLPQEKYQHFYQGLPSTNGLSGKWISRLIIYSQESVPVVTAPTQPDSDEQGLTPPVIPDSSNHPASGVFDFMKPVLWVVIACGATGIVFVSLAIRRLRRNVD